jgi:hypothetical protein
MIVIVITISRSVKSNSGPGTPSYTGRFIMFSIITNIYNKKTKGPTLMELITATGKTEQVFF